ncbi:3594_t:CDS:2, partial [Gigaspora rosea]
QSAAAAPSPSSAANTASSTDLPTFNYTLTQESPANREQLCASNKAYCSTNCGVADPPMNFCNNVTMGWGCGCSNKACKTACQSDAVPADKKIPCNQACSAAYSDKCGTPSQPACYYNTSDINTTPTYTAPLDDSKNSTSGAFSISSAISALTIVAAGMMML